MSILVDKNTRLVVQGITGREGAFHTKQMIDYGTNVVAGVTPGKGGEWVFDTVPVFDTVKEAVDATGANTSIIYVPARFAADAIIEAADAGVDLVVCITEGLPVLDMVQVRAYLDTTHTRLIGPNCPGLITPGAAKVGIIPGHIMTPGTRSRPTRKTQGGEHDSPPCALIQPLSCKRVTGCVFITLSPTHPFTYSPPSLGALPFWMTGRSACPITTTLAKSAFSPEMAKTVCDPVVAGAHSIVATPWSFVKAEYAPSI